MISSVKSLSSVLLIGFVIGCGQSTSTFSGTVTYQGQPIRTGVIYFLGPAPQMQMGMGTIQDNGRYVATDVPVGEVHVSFQVPGLPAKYCDPNKSELVFVIASKMTSLDIAIP